MRNVLVEIEFMKLFSCFLKMCRKCYELNGWSYDVLVHDRRFEAYPLGFHAFPSCILFTDFSWVSWILHLTVVDKKTECSLLWMLTKNYVLEIEKNSGLLERVLAFLKQWIYTMKLNLRQEPRPHALREMAAPDHPSG